MSPDNKNEHRGHAGGKGEIEDLRSLLDQAPLAAYLVDRSGEDPGRKSEGAVERPVGSLYWESLPPDLSSG